MGRSIVKKSLLIEGGIYTGRKQMENLAEQHDFNLLHPEVVKASQALDALIVQAMKQKPAGIQGGMSR
ncbi:hypothetical protein PghCCS26_46540 [Paenibacillus glycanilyticus]|uniref:Uncharacterized protein n=1 Tax=Paenibacillus glycanilyticus TaxID=126569 RepID=A0ABQ6NSN2_9BACL|nr:aspartyl-phosphate phosphatase Spo0E family protein [Paenibacillus glycanilyticus]GMK47524.1 hypothetical protein PghCCS26_46540 [Paenibacillus glycanilyticus]